MRIAICALILLSCSWQTNDSTWHYFVVWIRGQSTRKQQCSFISAFFIHSRRSGAINICITGQKAVLQDQSVGPCTGVPEGLSKVTLSHHTGVLGLSFVCIWTWWHITLQDKAAADVQKENNVYKRQLIGLLVKVCSQMMLQWQCKSGVDDTHSQLLFCSHSDGWCKCWWGRSYGQGKLIIGDYFVDLWAHD